MEFSNQKRSKSIRRAFNLIGITIVIVGLIFLWLKMDIALMITIGVFTVYVGISVYANLCFISFSTNNGKVLIKYYPIISILKKEFESIEFSHQSLVNFQIEQALGFADLTIAIKTKRGIAEYPTISLAALSKAEIGQIKLALEEIIRNNRKGV
jgi:hypothetical protein